MKRNIYNCYLKRFIDLVLVIVALLCLWWLIVLVAIVLHFANKGAGIFFYQNRPGLNEKIFKIIKFKSMTDERDADGNLLPNEKRLTKVGAFVRRTSLDELPQLFNVLKGEMSLIGPRPLLPEYLPYYTEREKLRHTVRPGISGWAQVNGRNAVSWDQKLEYDAYYVEHLSFALDCKVILRTLKNVLEHKDVQVVPKGTLLSVERHDKVKEVAGE